MMELAKLSYATKAPREIYKAGRGTNFIILAHIHKELINGYTTKAQLFHGTFGTIIIPPCNKNLHKIPLQSKIQDGESRG